MAVLKISDNVGEDEDEPNILINSEHHAREVVTPVIALYIIDQLTENYSTYPPHCTPPSRNRNSTYSV